MQEYDDFSKMKKAKKSIRVVANIRGINVAYSHFILRWYSPSI
jgi:hypothetical protein